MKLLFKLTGAFTALLSSKSVLAEYTINMTKGVTDISNDIWGLHMMVFWVCVAIGVVVLVQCFIQLLRTESQGELRHLTFMRAQR